MSDSKPDPNRQPEACKKLERILSCPNMIETGGGFEGEQYRCKVCGASVYLDYDEMR